MLRDRQLDIGIISNSTERIAELQDRPLLKDPFVIASPLNHEQTPLDLIHKKPIYLFTVPKI